MVECFFWQAFSENFTGLELEDGGGRGTSGTLKVVRYVADVISPICCTLVKIYG